MGELLVVVVWIVGGAVGGVVLGAPVALARAVRRRSDHAG